MLRLITRAVGFVTLAVLLTGCGGILVAYKDPIYSEDEIAILDGFHRYYFVYIEEADISSVDGIRPEGLLGWVSTARLLPGRHWVEVVLQSYFGGGGGYTRCAFEEQFEAGHRYKIKPHSAHSDEPWYQRPPGPWWQTMGLEIWDKKSLLTTRQIRMMCFEGTPSFCREDKDCSHHRTQKCEFVPGNSFGTCK